MDASLAGRRTGAFLVTLAMLALLLAAVGIYGILSQPWPSRPTREASAWRWGARRKRVLELVLRPAATVVGIALGLAGAFGLSRLTGGLLFEVSATDRATFLAVPVVLFVAAPAACFRPGRRFGWIRCGRSDTSDGGNSPRGRSDHQRLRTSE